MPIQNEIINGQNERQPDHSDIGTVIVKRWVVLVPDAGNVYEPKMHVRPAEATFNPPA
jgi:hypothetical protein